MAKKKDKPKKKKKEKKQKKGTARPTASELDTELFGAGAAPAAPPSVPPSAPPPDVPPAPPPEVADGVEETMEEEAKKDSRGKYCLVTMSHSELPGRKKPLELGKVAFFQLLVACCAALNMVDIAWACVVQERHKDHKEDRQRNWHLHAAVEFAGFPRWAALAKMLRDVHGVAVHFSMHSSYLRMWDYLTRPTRRKPLSELDPKPYYSKDHPNRDSFKPEVAHKAWEGRREKAAERQEAKRAKEAAAEEQRGHTKEEKPKRQRISLSSLVKAYEVKTKVDFEVMCGMLEADGDSRLADWYARHGSQVPSIIRNVWAIGAAPEKQKRQNLSRLEWLEKASTELVCTCEGKWAPGARRILENQGFDPKVFCAAVCKALDFGAVRGVHVACIGVGGAGKSTLLESLEVVFEALPKPQRGSTFPLAALPDAEIILWQDYEHHEGTVAFSDLLSWLVNESIGVREPGVINSKYKNLAPLFYSGRGRLVCGSPDPTVRDEYNDMMDDRFSTWLFQKPLPKEVRDLQFPKCGRCCAAFYLSGLEEHRRLEGQRQAFLARRAKKDKAEQMRLAFLKRRQAELAPTQATAPAPPRRSSLDEEEADEEEELSDDGGLGLSAPGASSSSSQAPAAELIDHGGRGAEAAVPAGAGALRGAAALAALRELMGWKANGDLSEDEFAAAKKKILG